jgi:geranylgeranyl diphosphate synthase type II
MHLLPETILSALQKKLDEHSFGEHPIELYEPISYILNIGGKRLRPLLTLLTYRMYQEDWESKLLPALSVEVFHNFSLMHDDIMDQAPLRRGQTTVHEKWNVPVAILSGDVMLVRAYDLLLEAKVEDFKALIKRFNETAAGVCEGQQEDMNFESRADVQLSEYLEMIRKKTAILLGFSMELGGILAGCDKAECERLEQSGTLIGIGFQLMDDLLDVYGDQTKFGKQVGGDIISNKKTYLLLRAMEKADTKQEKSLNNWLQNRKDADKEAKVAAVTALYDELEIRKETEALIADYFERGMALLHKTKGSLYHRGPLLQYLNQLMQRQS